MNMGVVEGSTFFKVQVTYCIDTIKDFWHNKRVEVVTRLQSKDNVVILGECTIKLVKVSGINVLAILFSGLFFLATLTIHRWLSYVQSWVLCSILHLHRHGKWHKRDIIYSQHWQARDAEGALWSWRRKGSSKVSRSSARRWNLQKCAQMPILRYPLSAVS